MPMTRISPEREKNCFQSDQQPLESSCSVFVGLIFVSKRNEKQIQKLITYHQSSIIALKQ